MIKENNNIAFYCSSTSWGGLEMNTVRYAGWMQERGWPVKIFCVKDSKIFEAAANNKIPTIVVNRNRKYADIRNAIRVKKLFKHHNIKLCWFRDTRDFSILGWVKRLSGGDIKLLYQQAMQLGVSKRDILHTQRFKKIDAWVSTLNFLAAQVKSLTRFPHHKIYVVPLGVDFDSLNSAQVDRASAREHYKLDNNAVVYGVIGRLDKLKGQHLAIEALGKMHAKGYLAHLLIVGESTLNEEVTYEASLKEQVSKLNLNDYVKFAPYSKNVELFYKAIDLFLLCSKAETFGTVTIEAMAFQKAIIGTNSSGTPEILEGECGILFEPENAVELSFKMQLLMDNDALRQKLVTNAYSKFQQYYSKDASMNSMENLVMQLLK
jgi:glycosyltransferase involved in cell wall biosynthesis